MTMLNKLASGLEFATYLLACTLLAVSLAFTVVCHWLIQIVGWLCGFLIGLLGFTYSAKLNPKGKVEHFRVYRIEDEAEDE